MLPVRWAYLLGLLILAGGMPWSRFMLSLGQFVLAGAWLLEWAIRLKHGPPRAGRFFGSPAALITASLFLIFPLGLLWTENMDWGWDLCRIVLPLLLFPFYFSVLPEITRKERELMLGLFVAATVITSLVSFSAADQAGSMLNFRKLSPFTSHIRLSMMITLSIALMVRWIFTVRSPVRWALLLPIAWSLFYLDGLGAGTSFAVLLILLVIATFWWTPRELGRWRHGLRLASVAIVLAAGVVLGNAVYRYFKVQEISLVTASAGGEAYLADDRMHLGVERGRQVWSQIAPSELQRAWDKRSDLDLKGHDEQGQELQRTLLRYMTSMGLSKDSVGVAALGDTDIRNVELGMTWADLGQRNTLRERIDQVIFEVDQYLRGGDPSGSSVAMRLEFWRAAKRIIVEHPWTGVGTGDTPEAFAVAYVDMHSPLDPDRRLRAHQQFLTFAVSWGLPGLLFCLFALCAPLRWLPRPWDPMLVCFLLITFFAFLTDDTLERQTGVSFVAFFFSFFVLLRSPASPPGTPPES